MAFKDGNYKTDWNLSMFPFYFIFWCFQSIFKQNQTCKKLTETRSVSILEWSVILLVNMLPYINCPQKSSTNNVFRMTVMKYRIFLNSMPLHFHKKECLKCSFLYKVIFSQALYFHKHHTYRNKVTFKCNMFTNSWLLQ